MLSTRCCLLPLALLGVLLALLATKPELILPHKIHAAVSMKGWEGFSKVVVANIAQRTRGQRTTKSREAWYRLLESLRDIDVEFLSPRSDVVTAEEVAQGHEFILHLLSIGLKAYVINADTTRPVFKNLFNPDSKWLVDQPDAVYLTATISTTQKYVIDGTHSSGEVYFSFTVYSHDTGGGWAKRIVAETAYPKSSVSGRPIAPASGDGRYRLYVSATKPMRTLESHEQWLQIPGRAGPGEVSIISRHYFEGPVSIQMVNGRTRNDVPVTISVDETRAERNARGRFPPIPSDENVAQRIDFLSNFLIDHTVIYAPGGRMSKTPSHRIPAWYSIVSNAIGAPGRFMGSSSGAGAPDVHYAAGPWKLLPHEALIIQAEFPNEEECVFANVLLLNKYLQSLDYQHGRLNHFNRKQLKRRTANGSATLVLAHQDPGEQYNWLDTEARETGIVFFRYFLNTATLGAATTRVVDFASLSESS